MNSSVASCCTCFRMASCASGTSASWPIANVPPPCHFVFSCSARLQLHRPNKTRQAPATRAIFGSVPSVLDRWWSSRGSRLPRCNFVLHLWSPPHETTLNITNTLRSSARSVASRLIADQIPSSGFPRHSLHNIFSHLPASGRFVSSAVLRRITQAHLYATSPLHSICIGPASAAIAAGLPSSRCIESAQTHRARVCSSLTRASDTTLGHGAK